jgi:hypothetical protein
VNPFIRCLKAPTDSSPASHGVETFETAARYEIATEPGCKRERIKEAIVRFKGYLNKELVGESVAEFNYQSNKCGRRVHKDVYA